MTDHAWDEGMALLEANLRDTDKTPAMKALRGATLRAALDHLTDHQWALVVQEALRSPTGWFPVLGELEDYAARLPQEPTRAALPDDTRTPEEKRADAKRLIGVLRDAIGEEAPPEGGDGLTRAIPTKPVVATEERMEMLRAQAREIGRATATAVEEIEGRG